MSALLVVVLLGLAVAGPVAAVAMLWWASRRAPRARSWHETVPAWWRE